MNTSTKKTIFFLSFFFLLSAGFMYYYWKTKKDSPGEGKLKIVGTSKVGPFSFISQEGKTITDKDVAGKIRVVEYFFTTCKGICPKMNESLATVYEQYRHDNEVVFLSHTVDPVHDTVGAMMAYSQKFNADPQHWIFLTGEKQALYNMARYNYLISAQDDTSGVSIDKDFIHDNHFVLVDREDNIRGFYDGLDQVEVKRLITDIKRLKEEK
ncbi:MAG: SCO family protein [Flavipsychrobacter sp.]|nr:SCO family protein [Flavipsychrobacter sp.]